MTSSLRLLATAALAAAGATLLVLPAAAPAAPAPSAGSAAIQRPAKDAAYLGKTVSVSVRVGAGVKSFRARIGAKTVTGAFPRTGTVRTAKLRVGSTPGLRFGKNTLYIRTTDRKGTRRFTQRSFVVARATTGIVGRSSAAARAEGGARLSLSLARPGLEVTVIAGGTRTSYGTGGRARTLRLSADEGLRPGANRLHVRVLDRAKGVYQTVAVTLALPATRPVAGAGPAHQALVGERVRLDARASLAATRGAALRYRWQLVRGPKGARPALRYTASQRPSVTLPAPGRYVYRVTVQQVAPTRGGTLRETQAVAPTGPADTDTITIDGRFKVPGIGAPLDTIATQNGATGVLLQNPYGGAGGGFWPAGTAAGTIQVVVLNRLTGAFVSNNQYLNTPAGTAQLVSALSAPTVTSDNLVIVTKPSVASATGANATAAANINKALASIGVDPVPANVSTGSTACTGTGQCSVFSAIGVPGVPAGEGHVNPGLAGLAAGVLPGDLHGFLQDTGTPQGASFVFGSTERVPFDTGNPGANPAVVSVGSNEEGSPLPLTTHTSLTLDGPGWFVLILDAGSLAGREQGTFPATNAGLAPMVTLLEKYENDQSAVVIVRSIGAVGRVNTGTGQSGNWDSVANALRTFGGSYFGAQALNGGNSQQYAQVGPANVDGSGNAPAYPTPWTQVASHERSGTGQLTGLLARTTSNQWFPSESLPSDVPITGTPLASTLTGLISLPVQPWPARSTPGEQNLAACIAQNIDSAPMYPPIESNYTTVALKNQWNGWIALIGSDKFTAWSQKGCGTFTQSDYTNLTTQLTKEWKAVGPAMSLAPSLTAPFTSNSAWALADIQTVIATINEDIGSSSSSASYDAASLSSDLLWAVASLPVAGEVSDAINLLAGGLGIASDLNVDDDGASAADVSATGADLGDQVEASFQNQALAVEQQVGAVISDPNKLAVAAANASGLETATADWQYSVPDVRTSQAADALLIAARRQAYTTLMPTVYANYRLSDGDLPNAVNPNTVTTYPCSIEYANVLSNPFFPFSKVPEYGGVAPTVSGEGTVEQWVYATPDTEFLYASTQHATFPGEGLLQKMFTPQTDSVQSGTLFNQLQYAVDAYGDSGSKTIGVTHKWTNWGYGQRTNQLCSNSPMN